MQYSQLLTNRSDDHHRFNGQIDLEFMKQFELYVITLVHLEIYHLNITLSSIL